MHSNVVRVWSRERQLRMLCFQLHPRPSRLRDARCSGGKMTCCTREQEISSKLHFIHRRNISFKLLDWWLRNFSFRLPHKFCNSPILILTKMLIWNEKGTVNYGDFPCQRQLFPNFCSLEPLLQITGGMKKNYVISGQEWSGRELSREPFIRAVVFYVSRSYINSSFHVLYKPRQE